MNDTPEPIPQEAIKLPDSHDEALLGATVDPHAPDRFVYSLRKLTLGEMKRSQCSVEEARKFVTETLVMPLAREHGPQYAPVFVNDELVLGNLTDKPKSNIIMPPRFNGRGR